MTNMDLSEEQIKREINTYVKKHWDKMVADSKRVAGANYDVYGKDLLAFCLSELLTKKSLEYQYKLIVEDNRLPNYIGRAMALNIKSHTSPFYSQYRRYTLKQVGTLSLTPDIEDNFPYLYNYQEDLLTPKHLQTPEDCVMHALQHLDFYHQRLVTEYYLNGMSYLQMNKKYRISLNSLKKDIAKGIELIKEHCNKL